MHPVFSSFKSIFTTQLILENSNKLKVKSGEFLYNAGDEKLAMYIIMCGQINIVSVGLFGTGSIIGEEWLFDKKYKTSEQSAYCP